jgi:hypothetical protein
VKGKKGCSSKILSSCSYGSRAVFLANKDI